MTPLAGGVQVDETIGAVVPDPWRLTVPMHHLLLVLLTVAFCPDGSAVNTGEDNSLAHQNHEHCLLTVPELPLLTS